MMREAPTITKSARTMNAGNVSAYAPTITSSGVSMANVYGAGDLLGGNVFTGYNQAKLPFVDKPPRFYEEDVGMTSLAAAAPLLQPAKEKKVANQRRIVKVVVIDPDQAVPLDQCVLYSGEEKLTDLDDQELFFELDIKKMLDEHNAKRVTIVDKKASEKAGREIKLEPTRVRDLKMAVVDVAKF